MEPPAAASQKGRRVFGRISLTLILASIATTCLFLLLINSPISYLSKNSLHSVIGTSSILSNPLDSSLSRRDEDYSCSATKPCSNGACCGPSGYCGYGPASCGTGCVSQCNATAECGQFSSTPGKTCPLNVCCSEFGFCGTTVDFCDVTTCQSNCGSPLIPSGVSGRDVRERVIGYYEAWSARRKCHEYPPEAIAVDGLTHVNFAFASIEPGTYEITTMDSATEAELFSRTADIKTLKSGNADLQVFVAIGGWTFSDNGTDTQPLFGEIAASPQKRKTFANNLVKFMRKYGFDGVDLDWEYPGAPDRGGLKEEDFKNYPLLLKTMRETFDASPRGGYGITFTIPSSYWYLRWFDLEELVKYADWINLMSYDLHGVWDQNNPIGNVVQAHTNITEISLACDLLWRNNIPPKKVVLGVGFYGRAFTLSDKNCATPGCSFSGASKKGACTGEGGILGYFEIQDILQDKKRKIKLTHDEDAAVNYLTYDNNQWISYDDKVTFAQKVDWANDIGLGGLMIWAVDLDDSKLSALSGLLGRTVGIPDPQAMKDSLSEAQNWASMNGEKCTITKCGGACSLGTTQIGIDIECSGGQQKKICCPTNTAPQGCLWRGGETGSFCNGQCHAGEVTMFESRGGDGKNHYCSPGQGHQVFCCPAPKWKALIDSCSWGDCGASCPSTAVKVSEKYDPVKCEYAYGVSGSKQRPLCCPKGTELHNCHWVGQGDCADNTCDDNDVEFTTDKYGNSSSACGWERGKVMCCDAPKGETPFLPVALDRIFPTLPPAADIAKFDLQTLGKNDNAGSNDPFGDVNKSPFGFVLIDGPSNAVTTLSKRDGSHYEFLSCDQIVSTERQKVRIVCMDDGPDSNCEDIHEDGLEGTIVKMPDGCGSGTYAVAHALEVSEDQSMPESVKSRKRSAHKVMDLTFDYDFGLVKRATDPIYLRVDYSNLPGYWNTIVDSPGEVTKRSIDKRFFGTHSDMWYDRFIQVKETSSQYTTFYQEINEALITNVEECDSEASYADIRADGYVKGNARWGFSLVGTISPFNLEETFGFLDTTIDMNINLKYKMQGVLDLPFTMKDLFTSPITLKEFSHPGIISFKPSLQVPVGIVASGFGLKADFSTAFRSQTDNYITQFVPSTVGPAVGQTKFLSAAGAVKTWDGTIGGGTSGNMRVSFNPTMAMDITIEKYNTTTDLAKTHLENSYSHYFGFERDESGCTEITGGVSKATTGVSNSGDQILWDNDDDLTRLHGSLKPSRQLHLECPTSTGSEGVLDSRGIDMIGMDTSLFNDLPVLSCLNSINENSGAVLYCNVNLTQWIPEGDINPESGINYAIDPDTKTISKRDGSLEYDDYTSDGSTELHKGEETLHVLEKRGKPRTYTFCANQKVTSRGYPSIGDLIGRQSVLQDKFAIANPPSCPNPAITDNGPPDKYVTEHTLELQTIKQFLEAVTTGNLPSGATFTQPIPCSFFASTWETDYDSFPSQLSIEEGNPHQNIMSEMGTTLAASRLVICETTLNSMKMTLWQLNSPVSPTKKWPNLKLEANIDKALAAIRRVIAVYSYLNMVEVNDRLIDTANAVRARLETYETVANADPLVAPNIVDLVGYWDIFIRDLFDTIEAHGRTWAQNAIAELRVIWQARAARAAQNRKTDAKAQLVLGYLQDLDTYAALIEIDYTSLD